MSKNIIEVTNLKKYFGDVKAVDDISFNVQQGEVMGFLGPNGAGKSTTIKCILNILNKDSGEIKLFGKNSATHHTELMHNIGFSSTEFSLHQNWTGWEHLNISKSIRQLKTIPSDLIERFDYDPTKKVKSLSTGNKQKLSLILAIMHNPELLILDEPTAGLDPLLQQEFYKVIDEQSNKGTTIFMSSHNLSEVERLCDKVNVIRKGKIVAVESILKMREMRLYTVKIFVDSKEDEKVKKLLEKNKIDIKLQSKGRFELAFKGDVNNLLEMISKVKLNDIQIQRASLEDLFLEYYKA